MASALQNLFDIIVWVLVPFLLILTLWKTYSHLKKSPDARTNDSSRAGFWAGFILFVIIFTYQVAGFLKTSFPQGPIFRGFDLGLSFSAALLAFLMFFGGRKVVPSHLKGWSIFASSLFTFYSFFHYLFIRTYNEFLLSVILGLALGVLVHNIVSPPAQEFPKLHH
jgi:hypothetical protein